VPGTEFAAVLTVSTALVAAGLVSKVATTPWGKPVMLRAMGSARFILTIAMA
jgi:hypothetical protein